jgi:hypothetical protein
MGFRVHLFALLAMSRLVLGQSEYFPISDTTVLVYTGTYTQIGDGLRSIDTIVVRFYGIECNSNYCGYTKLIEKSGVTIGLGDTTAYGPVSSMVYERMPVVFPFGPSAEIRILTVNGTDAEVFLFNGSMYDFNLFVPDERSSDFSRSCSNLAVYAKGIGMLSSRMALSNGRSRWTFQLLKANGRKVETEGVLRYPSHLIRHSRTQAPAPWLEFNVLGKRVRIGDPGMIRVPLR